MVSLALWILPHTLSQSAVGSTAFNMAPDLTLSTHSLHGRVARDDYSIKCMCDTYLELLKSRMDVIGQGLNCTHLIFGNISFNDILPKIKADVGVLGLILCMIR